MEFAKNIAIFGATGGIGRAFISHLLQSDVTQKIYGLSRSGETVVDDPRFVALRFNYDTPQTMVDAAEVIEAEGMLDLVIVATGLLHDGDDFGPEKSLRNLNAYDLTRAYLINTVGPALVMKSFLPLLSREGKSVFAALSARVGSISDNRIGGWYGYRSAKAGLNQMLRTASIEHGRRWKESVVIGLHPGTVDTGLSEPFQRNVKEGKLFTPDYASGEMLKVIDSLSAQDTGKVFAYDGQEVPA